MFTQVVSIFSVALILPYNADTAVLMCTYGERPVCGSDGLTYTNMCDLDIARSLRPNLTMKHVGSCEDLDHTYARRTTYYDDDDFYVDRNFYGLPGRRPYKRKHLKQSKKTILSEMINTQSNYFTNVHTQN
ncbi:uncharacterized protein LOC123690963 [Colias croceus]|uniref:uncharacterized protein LOC123690963 n=1 Tax=Colias crocea TaxID=72248 RepID=UPI001E279E28|nr:uncharacterized protein LOC123690963 [Colias croceus]